jgi:hypothetical protein
MMIISHGTGHNSSLSQDKKKEIYLTNYGNKYEGITISSRIYDGSKFVGTSNTTQNKVFIPMSDEQCKKEREKKAVRRIKDAIYPNDFQLFALLTWKTKKKRWDTDAQDADVRKYFNKLHRKYPEITAVAVRHKNPDGTGYHVHVLLGNFPRNKMRMKKGEVDSNGHQLYCLLGWYPLGRATAEYIVDEFAVKNYLANRKKIRELTAGIHSIVYRTRNLVHTERKTCGMSDEEIDTLLTEKNNNDEIIYDQEFSVEHSDGNEEKLRYVLTEKGSALSVSGKGGMQK